MIKKTFIILTILAAGAMTASAQNTDDVNLYQEAAGSDLPLYRGRQMPDYSYLFNGTYYRDNLGYRKGSICYGGKVYNNVLMNIDAYRQALYVKYNDSAPIWELERDLIDWFTIGGVKFVNLRFNGVQKAPEGFFEVLYEGQENVYRLVTKNHKESVEVSGFSRIGYYDPHYKDRIYVFFEFKESFWFLDKNGKIEKFSSRNYLIKKHPQQKKAIKAKVKEERWDDLEFDKWCREIMNYIESAK